MTIGKIISGLQLLVTYEEQGLDTYSIRAEHDTIYAGPALSKIPDDVGKQLETLGWIKNEDEDCWMAFT